MSKTKRYSPEIKERAVRLLQEVRRDYPSLWATFESIATKCGCAETTLHERVKRHEIDSGIRDGMTTAERERIKSLEREVKELRQAIGAMMRISPLGIFGANHPLETPELPPQSRTSWRPSPATRVLLASGCFGTGNATGFTRNRVSKQ